MAAAYLSRFGYLGSGHASDPDRRARPGSARRRAGARPTRRLVRAGRHSRAHRPPPPADTAVAAPGAVRGTVSADGRRFLGIPYAAPPTGALRFAPPRPAA